MRRKAQPPIPIGLVSRVLKPVGRVDLEATTTRELASPCLTMSTIDEQLVRELLSSEPRPTPARKPKQTKAHRRRQARLRGAKCTQVLRQRGFRHAVPLIEALVEFAAISDKLPYASQVKLAQVCGVDERTVRRWLVICERLGVLEVFRSKPHVKDGSWTRQTNRYLLCDRKAATTAIASPLRRRRRKNMHYRTRVSSNPSGFELAGVATNRDDPLKLDPNKFVERSKDSKGLTPQKFPTSNTSPKLISSSSPPNRALQAHHQPQINSAAVLAARAAARKALRDTK